MRLALSPQNSGKYNTFDVFLADLEVAAIDLVLEDPALISESFKSKFVLFENLGLLHWNNLSIWGKTTEPCRFIWVDNGIEFEFYHHERV